MNEKFNVRFKFDNSIHSTDNTKFDNSSQDSDYLHLILNINYICNILICDITILNVYCLEENIYKAETFIENPYKIMIFIDLSYELRLNNLILYNIKSVEYNTHDKQTIKENEAFEICINCKKVINSSHIYLFNSLISYCSSCLLSSFKVDIQNKYVEFIRKNHILFSIDDIDEIEIDYNHLFRNGFFQNENTTLISFSVIEKILSVRLSDILHSFKSIICVQCLDFLQDERKITTEKSMLYENLVLPCCCVICSDLCLDLFINETFRKGYSTCICGSDFSIKELVFLFTKLKSYENQENRKSYKVLKTFVELKLKSTCFKCLKEYDKYSDERIRRVFFLEDGRKMSHVLCETCFEGHSLKSGSCEKVDCFICDSQHIVLKISNGMNFNSEEDQSGECIVY